MPRSTSRAPARRRRPRRHGCGSADRSRDPRSVRPSQDGIVAPVAAEKRATLDEIVDGHDAGHDRHVDAGLADPLDITLVEVVVEEELGDRPRRSIVDLALQKIDIGGEIGAFRVLLGIGRHGDLEVVDGAQARDELHRVPVAVGMGRVGRSRPRLAVAAQRHEMADFRCPGTAARPDPPPRAWRRRRSGAPPGRVRSRAGCARPCDACARASSRPLRR